MSEAGTWTWRDAGGVARLARWLLYVSAAFFAGSAVLRLIDPGSETINAGVAVIVLGKALVFLVTVIVVLRWTYVANANARALGATDLSGSPAWAVGWYFVPIAFLGMPYVTVRDMWRASVNPRDWQAEPTPRLVVLWWTCWIIGLLALSIAGNLEDEFSIEAASAAQLLRLVSDVVWVPSALLLAAVIDRLQAIQVRARSTAVF